ncbi:phospholipase [Pseudomonas hormoni]|uniref:Phospholipase n=1 Tax=Pseudomonas hormoni TaxID=3093767 RepID=A0ABX8F231_9PSED|nr:phospholipase [Pseudomonas hormoni]QVW25982.1 phospholipase [Pseudomonas hormoni]
MNSERNTELPNFPYIAQDLKLNRWMSDIPIIDALTITQLVLPGAHNAGADRKASYIGPGVSHWAACQNHSFYYQLTHGARALDLRLEDETGRNGGTTFWFHHKGWRSSRSLENLIMNVIRFLQENPDEFIVLDFHELRAGNQYFNYKEFNRLLVTHLGDRIIPRENALLTLGSLKQISRSQRVLVAAQSHPEIDRTYFCRQLKHEWSGIGDTNTDELKAHITRVMKYPPSDLLPWSLSATSYLIHMGPVSIEALLDQWFDPAISDWPLKSSIINADFFEKSNLVKHCRTANIIKANGTNR